MDLSSDGGRWDIELSAEARRILEAREALSLLPALERGGASAETVKSDVFDLARGYFAERVTFFVDEAAQPAPMLEFAVVEVDEKDAVAPGQADSAAQRKHFFVVGKWSGALPEGARAVHVELPGDTAGVVIRKIAGQPAGPVVPYFPGEKSRPLAVPGAAPASVESAGSRSAEPATGVEPADSGGVFVRYLVQGFRHIIPEGLDHILFVLGLFFLSRKLGPLLWQVTAFTLAHSITLALAMLNIIRLPEDPVEIVIALSIAFVAIENLCRKDLSVWRPFVVFGFGLVHGLGFAAVFKDLLDQTAAPNAHFVTMLVAFNAGVEIGQLAVIGLAFLAVGWFWRADWYRKWISIPASILIACFGLFWAIERSAGWIQERKALGTAARQEAGSGGQADDSLKSDS